MKFTSMFVSLLAVSALVSCGGDDETTTTTNPNTDGSSNFQATLAISGATPTNGNGTIDVSSIKSDVNPAGGNQSIHILGTSTVEVDGEEVKIRHQIDINYYISYVDAQTIGNVTQVSHAWGSTLSGSLDGGISVCEDATACAATHLDPTLNTVVFSNQSLADTTNASIVGGTIVYP